MAQKLQIVPTITALVALLATRLPAMDSYAQEVDVRETGKSDFNDNGELVLKKVAVRVRLGQASYTHVRDISRTTMSTDLVFEIICRSESLRSGAETRSRTLELVGCVLEEMAGAVLLLPDGTKSEPVEVRAVDPVSDRLGPVEDCYGITILVSGYSQFSGRNATPGVSA